MSQPFRWQTTLDSTITLGFTGASYGSLARSESRVELSSARDRLAADFRAAGFAPVRFMHQTHSTVLCTPQQRQIAGAEHDGQFHYGRQRSPAVLTADCLPLLFAGYTRDGGLLTGAVHAGRVGLLAGIVSRAAEYFAASADLAAGYRIVIGPAICASCYEVPADLAAAAETQLPGIRARTRQGSPSLDLTGAAQAQLRHCGLAAERVEICTLEDADSFSYRGGDQRGRQAGIVAVTAN